MKRWQDHPKVELHLHLEGAGTPDFVRSLADEKSIDLSKIFDEQGHYDYPDFLGFLKVYEAACQVLRGPDDFRRLTDSVLENSARNGVVYTEIFVSPDFCGGGDAVAWGEYFDAICQGAQNAEAKYGIIARFILTSVRHLGVDQAKVTAALAAANTNPMMVGYGMGGDENHLRPRDFATPFDIAREGGLRLTNHAGEMAGAVSVAETLDWLKVERIGHGVRAIEDANLVRRLADEQIVLEVNPGSNVVLGVASGWAKHPIQRLVAAGVPVSISTDDPPFFHTDMTYEYQMLEQTFDWGKAEFDRVNLIAANAAFCDGETKSRILKKLGDTS